MKINLDELTNKQQLKGIFIPDLAFNNSKILVYDKESKRFNAEDGSVTFGLEHIALSKGFSLFLVSYRESFCHDDWNWDDPVVDLDSPFFEDGEEAFTISKVDVNDVDQLKAIVEDYS